MAKTITVIGVADGSFNSTLGQMEQAINNGRLYGIFKSDQDIVKQDVALQKLGRDMLPRVEQYIHEVEPAMVNVNGMFYYSAIVCHEPLEEHMAHEKAELDKY